MALDDVFRLMSRIPNKYLLTLAVAERARRLVQQAAFSYEPMEEDPVITALREVDEGKLQIQVTDEELIKALEGRSEVET
ncbi:MAG TPA: DNA-directed RNA polymerase subunit omega [Armatimonadetes bacterium]|nr:DNA-directed RNA polymerase subunit omega [Armatimonadota bacterium]